MSIEITSNATDAKAVVETSNITADEFILRRANPKQETAKPAQAEGSEAGSKEEAKVDGEAAKTEGAKPEAKDETKGKEVLSQVDLSDLTDEDIAELAQKGKSGLLKRIAELTAKRKIAEEKASNLERFIANQQQAAPSFVDAKVENNPYSKITKADELNSRYQEVGEVIEWAEEVLDKSDSLSSDEIAAVVEGKELTKADVKENLRKARKARDKYLPAQFKELQAAEQRNGMKVAFNNQARQEIPWLDGEDNDARKAFQAMISDPRLKKLEEVMPELAPQMGYILAHATNSMYARKSIALDDGNKSVTAPRVTPPKTPTTAAASSDRPEATEEKRVRDTAKRLSESGSINDFIALRTAQITKRKSIKA